MIQILVKELRAHAVVGIATGVLGATMLLLTLFTAISQQSPTYLVAASSFAMMMTPILAVIWARRLFVLEHRHGTYEFLAALPVHPSAIAAMKIVVVLYMVLSMTEGGALVVMFIAAQREVVGLERFARVIVAIAAHGFAWVGVAVAFAQLGRQRLTAWVVLLAVLGMLGSNDIVEGGLGLLSLDERVPNLAHPFGAAQLAAFTWGVIGTGFALFFVTLRGGAEVRRLFEPGDGYQRGLSIAIAMGALTVTALIGEALEDRDPNAARIDAVGNARVRVVASEGDPIHTVGVALDRELGAMADVLGATRWPPVVLRALHDRAQPTPVSTEWKHDTLYLSVRADAPDALTHALREVLLASRGGWPAARHAEAWMIDGLPDAWLAARVQPSATATTARALAASRNVSEAELLAWPALRRRLGRDLSAAVAWVGLDLAREECGFAPKSALERALPSGPQSGLARWIGDAEAGPICGRSREAFAADWKRALDAHRGPDSALPGVRLLRTGYTSAPVRIAIRPEAPLPSGTELWWSTFDALEALDTERLDVHRAEVDAVGGTVTVTVDPRSRIAATLARRVGEAGVVVISGWEEVGFE